MYFAGSYYEITICCLFVPASEEADQLSGQLRGRGPLRPGQGLWGPLSAEGPQGGASIGPGPPEGQSGPAVRRRVRT